MHEIRIPRLGWSMEEGTFVRWLKSHGESVGKGEPLFELEGDKNVQEVESVEAGRLHIPPDSPEPGSTVAVGTLLAYLLSSTESAPTSKSTSAPADEVVDRPFAAGPAARNLARELGLDLASVMGTGRSGLITKDDVKAAAEAKPSVQGALRRTASDQPVATPRARRAAATQGIDWTSLRGSGRGGRIRESDVLAAVASATAPTTASPSAKSSLRLSPRRKAIADRLRRSRQLTVPVTLTTTVDVTEFVALRQRLKAANPDAPPSFADITACLMAWVFARHSLMAVTWGSDRESLVPFGDDGLDIGIAVDTPEGLLVPVVRDIGHRSLTEVTKESRRLIDLAREGQLSGQDMHGGVFTITNLGTFGIDAFTPVINYPEIAILGLGAIRREPVFVHDDRISARLRMTLSLTFDHGAVDGAPAARFLQDIAKALSDPAAFMMDSVRC